MPSAIEGARRTDMSEHAVHHFHALVVAAMAAGNHRTE